MRISLPNDSWYSGREHFTRQGYIGLSVTKHVGSGGRRARRSTFVTSDSTNRARSAALPLINRHIDLPIGGGLCGRIPLGPNSTSWLLIRITKRELRKQSGSAEHLQTNDCSRSRSMVGFATHRRLSSPPKLNLKCLDNSQQSEYKALASEPFSKR